MFKVLLITISIFFYASGPCLAQDTLPRITVINQNGKAIISWRNTYGAKVANINIQRSSDSIKRFATVGSVLNPLNRENGYVDTKMPGGRIFYRVFVAFEGGDYIFTKSYRPVIDTSETVYEKEGPLDGPVTDEKKEPGKSAGIPPFVPSKFIFTGKDNNVIINLPNADSRKFSIKFFEETDEPLFEIALVKEPYLILDKANFLHSGWFRYHLFDNNILLEKFKFFIPKENRNGK